MNFNYGDRVRETSTTTGTGNFTLAGAVAQFQSFNAAFGTNVFFPYVIADTSGTNWECGIGYLSGTTTLVRNQVTASSNAGALVNFTVATDVWCDVTAYAAKNDNGGLQIAVNYGNFLV